MGKHYYPDQHKYKGERVRKDSRDKVADQLNQLYRKRDMAISHLNSLQDPQDEMDHYRLEEAKKSYQEIDELIKSCLNTSKA